MLRRPTLKAPARSRVVLGLSALALTAGLASGCDAAKSVLPESDDPAADSATDTAEAPRPVLRASVKKGATDVPVDTVVKVRAKAATLDRVVVRSEAGKVPGQISGDGTRWRATDRLEPGEEYTVRMVGTSAAGDRVRSRSGFTTQALTLDQQTYASVAPLEGETVGIGMPVVVNFDIPVTDKAAFERNMHVTTTPRQPGTWHWVSDNVAHYRPKKYWKAGTEVTVDVDVNGVHAGNGIYGQEDRTVSFSVGDAHIYKVDLQAHQMKVFANGELLRTLPITAGKPGFTTRSGVKVIMEKFESKRMNSETVGIPAGSAEAYDINNVQWAMRVTSSGEFIHAAPWSVGSQGHANVSHGCTGLSTADAGWLYAMTQRGDVVEFTGSDRPMEPANGYGDWNVSWADYQDGSALG